MTATDIKRIENQLSVLCRLPLRIFTRAGSMGDLGFGADVTKTIRTFDENHNIVKATVSVPQFTLHLDCYFRLSCGNEILLSRGDIFQPSSILLHNPSFDYETFLWDAPNANRFDTISSQYFGNDSFSCVVDKISVSALGDLKIHFSNGFLLEVSPDISGNEECWRFFEQKNDEHLIVSGQGVIVEQNDNMLTYPYDNNFANELDFIECLERGCEIEFRFNCKQYSITHVQDKILICEFYNETSEALYDTATEVLTYPIQDKCLGDILSKVKILSRSF